MTPVSAIEKLLSVNRDAAVLLLTGIAVFAAISIVGAYKIDSETAIRVGGFLFAFAVAATVLSVVVSDLRVRAVLGWFLVTMFIGWSVVLSIAILFQPGPFPPVYCLIAVGESCPDVGERIALSQTRGIPVAPESVVSVGSTDATPVGQQDGTSVQPGDTITIATVGVETADANLPKQMVFVQWGGVMTRDSVRAMMQALAAQGWNMQGADGGGERTEKAFGYNEVRYAPGAKADAERLAAELQRFNLTGKPIVAVESPAVDAGALEVWLSVV